MNKNRLEAFSDGVLAIVITIMVLELKRPDGARFTDLQPLIPLISIYALSYLYIGIYWNNHHHMFHATRRINGAVLWANLHLLFWLSLFPLATAWMGETHVMPAPVSAYGVVLLMAAIAYYILQSVIVADAVANNLLRSAVGNDWKGKLSPILYIAGIAIAFVNPWISIGIYTLVAFIWLIPDRRIERALQTQEHERL
jgi:uncharacterized membrane protein